MTTLVTSPVTRPADREPVRLEGGPQSRGDAGRGQERLYETARAVGMRQPAAEACNLKGWV